MSRTPSDEKEWRVLVGDYNLANSPGHAFRVLENKIQELYYNLSERPEISPRQIIVLMKLFQVGDITQTELATLINLDRSTLSEMSNRMVERGLLNRSVPEHDRRATLLSITEAGKEVLFATLPAVLRAQREIIAPLPDEYRAIFLRCLKMLFLHHTENELPATAAGEGAAKPARRRRTAKAG